MPCDLEQVDHSIESGLSSKVASDVVKVDLSDRFNQHVTGIHRIQPSDLHVRALPDADAAGNPALPHPVAKALGEHHTAYLGGAFSCDQPVRIGSAFR